MHNLSLSEMINSAIPNNNTIVDPIQPLTQEIETEPEVVEISENDAICINFTDFQTWLSNPNSASVANIINIEGAHEGTFIIQTISNLEKVKLIKDGNLYQIIDLGNDVYIDELKIFGENSFVIEFLVTPNITIKQFCSKTSFDVVAYVNIEGCEIPFWIRNFNKKHNDTIDIQIPIIQRMIHILHINTDFDEGRISLSYPKYPSENSHSKLECVRWFSERKKTIEDINHIRKIDSIISSMFVNSTDI